MTFANLPLNPAVPVIKNLVFEDVIGKESFAVVYRGLWEGKQVALKKIKLPTGIGLDNFPNIQEISVLR